MLAISVGLALTSCAPATPQQSNAQPSNPPINSPFLNISGRVFTYHGQTVYLRGVNLTNGRAMYDSKDYDQNEAIAMGKTFRSRLTEDERDYARLESWGVNVVRLGLDWHWFAADKDQFFAFVDQHIAWATSHRIWLIPVMFVPPAGEQDYSRGTRFWRNASYRNALKAFWVEVAQRYAEEPTIAGYDLLNEPSAAQAGVDWLPYAGELHDAIWTVDKNHFLVIESHADGQFSERLPLRSRVKYPNVVYSIHDYSPESMTHNGASGKPEALTYPGPAPDYDGKIQLWNKTTTDQLMRGEGRIPITWAQQAKVPLFIGEWGTVKHTTGYVRWVADHVELMGQWGVHWTYFAYREYSLGTDFGVFNGSQGMSSDLRADAGLVDALKAGLAGNVSRA